MPEPCVTPPAIPVRGPAGYVSVIVIDRDSAAGSEPHVLLLHPVNLTASLLDTRGEPAARFRPCAHR